MDYLIELVRLFLRSAFVENLALVYFQMRWNQTCKPSPESRFMNMVKHPVWVAKSKVPGSRTIGQANLSMTMVGNLRAMGRCPM